jgi:hypothetical protein
MPISTAAPPTREKAEALLGADHLMAALALSGRLRGVEKVFDHQALEKAERRWPSGISLHELLLAAAKRHGLDLHVRDVGREMPRVIRAAFASDGHFGAMLANLATRWVYQGFASVEQTYALIVARRPARDFRNLASYRFTSSFQFQRTGPEGQVKTTSIAEATAGSYTNAVNPFATLYWVPYTYLVNDDLDALTLLPKKLGEGAARTVASSVFATLLAAVAGGTVFSAPNGNLLSGTTSALSAASLASAEQALAAQAFPNDGTTCAFEPAALVVHPSLRHTGQALMQNRTHNVSQKWYGAFRCEASAYLTSATSWLLVTNPDLAAVVELATLGPNEAPVVSAAGPDFKADQPSVAFRGAFAFGVAAHEGRAGVWSAGA